MSSLLGYRRVSDLNTLSNIYWLNVSKFQSSNTKLLEVVLEIKSNTKSTQSGKINITQAKTSHLDQWQNSTLLVFYLQHMCCILLFILYAAFFSESLVFSVTHVERYIWFSSDTFFVEEESNDTSNGSFCVCAQSLKQKAWATKEIWYCDSHGFQDLSRQLMQRKPHYVELACEANLISLISLDFFLDYICFNFSRVWLMYALYTVDIKYVILYKFAASWGSIQNSETLEFFND